jgi:hypothetical protein
VDSPLDAAGVDTRLDHPPFQVERVRRQRRGDRRRLPQRGERAESGRRPARDRLREPQVVRRGGEVATVFACARSDVRRVRDRDRLANVPPGVVRNDGCVGAAAGAASPASTTETSNPTSSRPSWRGS